MARAIVKNPVGTDSGWEDIKIFIRKAYQQNYQIFTLTCSYEGVNYEVNFRIMDGLITVLVDQGDETDGKRGELITLLEDMDNITAIMNSLQSFYDLDTISEYDLFFQMKDLEELVEAYLNGGIVAGEVDSLGYWKTLFYKDGDNYIIGDKQSGNDITVSLKGDDIRFSVEGAEVKNDGLDILTKDVFENVFSKATANGICYLPMTWYEELLEFLGTKLSAFENDSRFVEKEWNDNRWYNVKFVDDPDLFIIEAYYDGVKYTAYQDGEIEQGVPNIVIEYDEGGNDIVANIMKEKLTPVWGALIDTSRTFEEAINNEFEYFSWEAFDEICSIALNKTYDELMKLWNTSGLIGDIYDEETDTETFDYCIDIILDEDQNEVPIYQRASDRYGYIEDPETANWDILDIMLGIAFILPVKLYETIVNYDYEVISATGIALEAQFDEIRIGETPSEFYATVLPNYSGTAGEPSYATNNEIYLLQSGNGEVNIVKAEGDPVTYNISGVAAGDVTITAISADGGYSDSFEITVLPQLFNVTLSSIDGPQSPMEVEEGTTISTDGSTIYIGESTGTANVEQGFVFDYFTATVDGVTTTLTDGNDITVESDMTLTAVSHENVSSDITLTLASSPSGYTTFQDENLSTISSITIPAGSTIYASGSQIFLGSMEDENVEMLVDATVSMPYAPDHRELNGTSLEEFTDYTAGTSGTLTLVIS